MMISAWDKLYPPSPHPPNINDFDITLLCILLRNICGLSPPSLGWDKIPNVADHSTQADIVRIKLLSTLATFQIHLLVRQTLRSIGRK